MFLNLINFDYICSMKIYSCQQNINSTQDKVFYWISSIGGDNGWYYANWLWKLRGILDRMLGGIGFRKGRRNQNEITVGEQLDFWRVEEIIQNEKMTLKAEIHTFGEGWMEFDIVGIEDGTTLINLKALYIPNGWFGILYWYLVFPLHFLVFNGLLKEIKNRAEAAEA